MKNSNNKPRVSIIVVNHNGKGLLKNCISSLYELDYPKKKIETIMVDNCSKDNSVGFMKKNFPRTVVLQNRINNFCSANNLGIKQSKGECVAILNNDTEVDKKWLSESIKVITMNNRIAAVGSKVLFKDGRIQSAGLSEFPYHYWGDRGLLEPDAQQYDKIQPVPSISDCSALYMREALNDVEFFDEDFNMYMEDVDICLRLRNKNWKIFYAPDSKVYHKLHGSGQDPKERAFYIERNRLLFIAKHFPEELAANIAGYGEISKLGSERFHELLIAVFNKLVKHQGSDNAKKIFLTLNQDIRKISNYSKHILQDEKDRASNSVINTKEACISEKEKQLTDFNATVRIQEDKIGHLEEEVKARDKNIQSQQGALIQQEKQLTGLNATIRIQEDKLRHLDEEVKARDKHIGDQHQIINTKDKCINEKDKQLNDLNIAVRTQEGELRRLEEEVKARDKQITAKHEVINAKDVCINEKDKQLNDLNATIKKQGDDLKQLDEKNQSQSIRLEEFGNELILKEGQLKSQKEVIIKKNSEISAIYNSETYRLFVRPVAWPIFSSVKSVFQLFSRKAVQGKINKNNISIAFLHSKIATAKYLQENEYSVKIINTGFREEKTKLLIDIWPYGERSHPQRHYAYFAIDISVSPRDAIVAKILYDWEKKMSFFVNGEEKQIVGQWRGELAREDIYLIQALLKDGQDKYISRLDILQRLTK